MTDWVIKDKVFATNSGLIILDPWCLVISFTATIRLMRKYCLIQTIYRTVPTTEQYVKQICQRTNVSEKIFYEAIGDIDLWSTPLIFMARLNATEYHGYNVIYPSGIYLNYSLEEMK